MMIFGVCFVLYLIKLSAGKGLSNITWNLSLRLRTHPTQNKYKKIVVIKVMLLLIEANHGQSIERRISISRPVMTTDQDKYANKN